MSNWCVNWAEERPKDTKSKVETFLDRTNHEVWSTLQVRTMKGHHIAMCKLGGEKLRFSALSSPTDAVNHLLRFHGATFAHLVTRHSIWCGDCASDWVNLAEFRLSTTICYRKVVGWSKASSEEPFKCRVECTSSSWKCYLAKIRSPLCLPSCDSIYHDHHVHHILLESMYLKLWSGFNISKCFILMMGSQLVTTWWHKMVLFRT